MKNKTVFHHIIFCSFVFIFAHLYLPSMFNHFEQGNYLSNFSDEYLFKALTFHQSGLDGLFQKRIFVTNTISFLINYFSLNISWAFYLVQFAFFLACLGILNKSGKALSGQKWFLNPYFFTFSFSILFSFFKPIYSWDEMAQYFFLFASLSLVYRKDLNLYLLFISLTASLLARETSILTFPGFVILLYFRHPTKLFQSLFLMFTSCLTYYLLIYFFVGFQDMGSRWDHYQINFKNKKTTIQTFAYLYLTLGLPTLLAYLKRKNQTLSPHIKAFVATALINTPIVLLATIAQEARLFSLPLIFLWPVYSLMMEGITFVKIKNFLLENKLLFVGILIMSILLKNGFRPSKAPASDAFREYLLFYSIFFFSGVSFALKKYFKLLELSKLQTTKN